MYQTVAALTRLAALVGYRADTRAQGWGPATRGLGIVTQRAGWRPFAGPTGSLFSSRCTYKCHSCAEDKDTPESCRLSCNMDRARSRS
jgi:hypothetical protein